MTESGMVTLVSELHSANASTPIDVTELPMVTFLSSKQFQKALSPIDFTVSGILTEVNPLQPSNA